MDTSDQDAQREDYPHNADALDVMDRVKTPRLNPGLTLFILFILSFIYVLVWHILLQG